MKRKTVFVILGAGAVILMAAAGGMWYLSMQPMYQPGMVRVMPPAQPAGSQTWPVEPGIELAHFAAPREA